MKTKNKILFVVGILLTIMFCVFGVLTFKFAQGFTEGSASYAALMVGCVFSFMFFLLSIGLVIASVLSDF